MRAFPTADFVYYEGLTFRVEWYVTKEGRMPAYEYYQRMRSVDQERLDHMVKYLADQPVGTHLPKVMYRVEDPKRKIYAFKPRDERFFNFTTEGRQVILTNAYHKHSQHMTKADHGVLDTAVRYREDYLRRVKEGNYYEH